MNTKQKLSHEQEYAIEVFVKKMQKHRGISGSYGMTYTKKNILYGVSGTGKLFVGQLNILYAISQKLNIASTVLMVVHANKLGGIQLQKIFFFQQTTKSDIHLCSFREIN